MSVSKQEEFEATLKVAMELAVSWRHDGVRLPANPQGGADELRALFDIELPEEGCPGEDVIRRLADAALPGLVCNTHPNFYGWVQGSSDTTGVAADLLCSAWGQNAGLFQTSPAAAIAEEVAAGWLLDLLRLPPESSIAFSTGATMASFICLSAARSEVLNRVGYDLEQDGLIGAPQIRVFVGREAHATIHSALRYLGFGTQNLTSVESDDQGRMIAQDLADKLAQGQGPAIIIAQAGHIHSGAFDPFNEIVQIASEHDAWVHIDGAFGLWARAVPDLHTCCEGLEGADSWSVDGHKWLQIPYDSGFAIVKDESAHRRSMSITASYLVTAEDDGRNPSNYGPELSRRARGFAVWAVLQALGRDGIEEMISRHCRCAVHLRGRLENVPGIRLLNDVVLNQVAIAFGDQKDQHECDRLTLGVIERIRLEDSHVALGASWKGQAIMRISIIAQLTDIEHIDSLADSIVKAWTDVQLT
jgi:glutamate/tyrosine decarboxylase-like PLP-dependent enzyme